MKYTYSKSGAMVTLNGQPDSLGVQISKNGKTLGMQVSRQQKEQSDVYMRSMGTGAGKAIRGDITSQYSVKVNIGEESAEYNTEFSGLHFDDWGNKVPDYNVNLEKGIPAAEYAKLCEGLSEQNSAIAQVFSNYVLNAEDLQKENNLSQSIFNQRLSEFLER